MSYSRRQLEAFGEPLGDSVTRKEGGRVIYGGGGGGGGTSTQVVDVPEWARGTAESTLKKTEALTTDRPFKSFAGQYDQAGNQVGFDASKAVAGMDPMQQRAYQGASNLQTAPQLGMASGLMAAASQRALNTGYRPGQFQNQYYGFDPYQSGEFQNQFQAPGQYQAGQFGADRVQAQDLQNYQMQAPADVRSQGYNAASMQAAQSGYNPQLETFQMGPAERVAGQGYDAATMQAAQTRFAPELERFQMGPAERVETQSFAQPGSADAYMSPYMQSVVGIQQREAQRAADIAGTQRGAQAAKMGAFGGSRQAIMEAEAARNLAQQKGDIQATGLQSAFQQAQQQFNAEQNARLQAQQANQQAGLTTGQQNLAANLGVQQLGTQTGLQSALANLSSEQQANVQNQAAQNQARGMNAQQAMQAALANQQAGLTVGQQNLASQIGTQQLGAGQIGLQTSLANLSSEQQANVQNQAAQNQAMGMNAQQAMQAALANQQAGLTTGQQNLAANLGIQQLGAGQNLQAQLANQQQNIEAQRLGEQSRQFGAGQGLTAAQLQAQYGMSAQQAEEASRQFASSQAAQQAAQGAQYGQAAQQLAEQSRQFGGSLGLQGLQAAMTGAGQLGQLGTQQFGQQKDILGLQNQFGGQQQAQEQALINARSQDFASAQRYPYQQLEFMSNILRGTPMGSVQTMYQAPPSAASQLVGAGTALYGASKMAKGGVVKKKSAGLAELALSKI
jgi:hypothetical protein